MERIPLGIEFSETGASSTRQIKVGGDEDNVQNLQKEIL
jgi:hypothetical protein